MSNQIDESTQHAASNSPDTTAPAKPSLRVLEPGLSSREEDLDNGPLLLALGDSLEDPVIPYTGLDLASQHPSHRRLERIELPFMPPRRLEDRGPESLPSVSQSGASLSVPLEDSVVGERDACLFSSSYEFSWDQDSGLCFGGEPFGVARTPDDGFSKVDPGSERVFSEPEESITRLIGQDVQDSILASLNMAGIGSSVENRNPTILHGDLELVSTKSSISSSTASSLGTTDIDAIAEPSDPKVAIAMHKYAERAVELLMDDFYRSNASQTSKGRPRRALGKVTKSVLDNDEGKRRASNGKSRAEPKSGERKAVGGDEESEDEDSQDKKRKPSVNNEGKKSQRWACPYVKWRPMTYECKIRPTQLRGINAHIKNIHWIEHCDRCWSTYSTNKEKMAHQDYSPNCSPSDPSPGFITKEMYSKIFENKPNGLSHKDQWFRLYEILFPGEPRGFSPYVDEAMDGFMDLVEVLFRGPRSRKILDEVISESQFEGLEREQLIKIVRDEYLTRMCQDNDLKDDFLCTPAWRRTHVIGNAQCSPVDAAGTGKEITKCERLYNASPPSPEETHVSHQLSGPKPTGFPVFDQYISAGCPTLGDDNSSAYARLAEFQGPVGSVGLRDSEGYPQENFDSLSPGYFENAWCSNSQTDGDYKETIPDALSWGRKEVLFDQA
ncbi:hypothetical protein FPOAC2_03548 [Fusarium poae]|uniref:C2H2-type domain-containing protein n=1 Tax=Fusarium poae TaxID=36050 RepID=A0A1B8B9E3_FUSPO|nr:hypothetical protein FPOAC1_003561 [Fusarium poae]KAG8677538.1 hypothetical protein FPOAC1_003561 [Fusarium poae]OBS29332.1 hypothetical protein FPOA_03268 [Fusarium poae]